MNNQNVDVIVFPTWSNPPRLIGDYYSCDGEHRTVMQPFQLPACLMVQTVTHSMAHSVAHTVIARTGCTGASLSQACQQLPATFLHAPK